MPAQQQQLSDIQNALLRLERAVGSTEGKVDTFIKQMEVQDKRATDLEVRTRRVENKQYWLSGFGSVIGMIFGALGVRGFH